MKTERSNERSWHQGVNSHTLQAHTHECAVCMASCGSHSCSSDTFCCGLSETKSLTYGFQVVTLMWMLVQEEVVTCRVLWDPFWQVFDFRWISVRQNNEFLIKVDFLLRTGYWKHVLIRTTQPHPNPKMKKIAMLIFPPWFIKHYSILFNYLLPKIPLHIFNELL